ncbi:MAG TPA: LPS assembly lipoprotein LptE [Stellaceae bacterium]|nr:LPS assembly lipoprotein LptE [Stellaceae bacterium]
MSITSFTVFPAKAGIQGCSAPSLALGPCFRRDDGIGRFHAGKAICCIVLLLLMLPLAACGFHPLYAESHRTADEPALAAVKVMPIADRMGQQLELSLREQLNPRGLSLETRYQLSVTLAVARADLGIQRDATATRGQVYVTAIIVLADAKTSKVLYRGSARSLSAFNVVNDAFAAQVAQDDSDTRTVRDLADEIRTRIAIFLQQHAG